MATMRPRTVGPRTVERWAAMGYRPSPVYCGDCQILNVRGGRDILHLTSCSEHPVNNRPDTVPAAMNPRTLDRWAALGYKPAAYCGECQVVSVPERGDAGPQVLRHLPDCSEHPDNRPWPLVPAAHLEPGDRVAIYGGCTVTVTSVEPAASDHDVPFVTLRYQWATDGDGEPVRGVWSLPATQRLPLQP